MNAEKLGERIYKRRKELKMTQKDLANLIGVSDRAVSKWETGRGFPDITLLESIAKALEMEVVDIFSEEVETETKVKDMIQDTLDYAKGMQSNMLEKIKKIGMIALSSMSVIGILVVCIVDRLMNGTLTWAIPVSACIVFGWLVLFPMILYGLKGIKFTLLIASILVIPFLYILVSTFHLSNVIFSIGWKASIIGICFTWFIYVLFKSRKFKYYQITSIIILVGIPINFVIQKIVEAELQTKVIDVFQFASYVISAIIAISIFLVFNKKGQES